MKREPASTHARSASADMDPAPSVATFVHASREVGAKLAWAALRQAAVDVDCARRSRRAPAPLALDLWRGLCAGRWSLVDEFERDGRRYLVARATTTAALRPHTLLSAREHRVLTLVGAGHSNKVIAYELGVSASTVGTHVARLAKKLGASSVAELIVLARLHLQGAADRPPRDRGGSAQPAAQRARDGT